MSEACELRVNGDRHLIEAEPDVSLLDVLHSELGLTGARFGCGMGLCGACFVIVDDAVVAACDTPLWSVAGKSVTTIEGLGGDGGPHPLQAAILDHQAGQCGYCLSGVIVNGAWLLGPRPGSRQGHRGRRRSTGTSAGAVCSSGWCAP